MGITDARLYSFPILLELFPCQSVIKTVSFTLCDGRLFPIFEFVRIFSFYCFPLHHVNSSYGFKTPTMIRLLYFGRGLGAILLWHISHLVV